MASENQKRNPFRIPQRRASLTLEEEYDRKEFKLWVEELPIGNIGQTARKIFDALTRLSHVDISPLERQEALEFLQAPLDHVLESLAGYYILDPLPLPKKDRQIARLRLELLARSVVAYKVVVDQFNDESFTGHMLHRRAHADAVYQVLSCLGLILLHCYQLYQSVPRHVWAEIHQTYRYARENELHGKEVFAKDRDGQDKQSTEDLYKQLLLLALAGPYRLLKGEVPKLYSALQRWAPITEIASLHQSVSDKSSFVVDINADQPPVRANADILGSINEGWMLITDKLELLLGKELERIQGDTQRPGVTRPKMAQGEITGELISKLMLAWGVGTSRGAERSDSLGNVVMICGLDALYGVMGGEVQPDFEQRRLGFEVSSSEVEDVFGRRKFLERDEFVISADNGLSELMDGKLEVEPAPKPDGGNLCTKVCEIFDQSVNGYHLVFSGAGDSRARVGELVGIREGPDAAKEGNWQLGVIRWMRTKKSKWLEFGVELLQGDVEPVAITRERGTGDITDYWCGFLQRLDDETTILLMPPFFANDQDRIFLIRDGRKHTINLNCALDRTDSFAQYLYDVSTETGKPAVGAKVKSASFAEETDRLMAEMDFESLWKSL